MHDIHVRLFDNMLFIIHNLTLLEKVTANILINDIKLCTGMQALES